MSVFVDTSAFFAVLDADDENHDAAKQVWEDLLAQEAVLICSNYVLVRLWLWCNTDLASLLFGLFKRTSCLC